jgi:deoxyribose-phosphate aldolase
LYIRPVAEIEPNPGIPFSLDAILAISVDERAVQTRAAAIPLLRPPESEWPASLLSVVRCIDLTALEGSETPEVIARLCAQARQPLPHLDAHVAAVCVYRDRVTLAVRELAGSGIPVAAVARFPAGTNSQAEGSREIAVALAAGAEEIDVVITRTHVLLGAWRALYEEIRGFRVACGSAVLKVILATGDLGTLTNVARASRVALMAGADFIKTSTGKEMVNATLPAGLVMARAIRDHHGQTGYAAGVKPSGGIRTAPVALDWLTLVTEELGQRSIQPALFRIGASSLLGDIEHRLDATSITHTTRSP